MNEQIRRYLKEKFVSVPEEWVSACIEFIKVEHGNSKSGNYMWLREKVYEQWLHSDLTQLGTSCLPFGLNKQKSTTIQGQFALQVNFIKDVGLPAYNQLQKLRKDNTQNTNVSAEKTFTSAWEPKPSRMLLMQLTDGTSIVQGMEYRVIPALSLSLKPGSKILLKGNMEVRRGIILLTREHVSVLGGEVDSLTVANAAENILRKALRLEESDEPIPVPEVFSSNDVTFNGDQSQYSVGSSASNQSRNFNMSNSNQQGSNNNFNSKLKGNQYQLNQNGNSTFSNNRLQSNSVSTNRPQTGQSVKPFHAPPSTIDPFEDDFDDFMDIETERALIEAEKKASQAFNSKKPATISPATSSSRPFASNLATNQSCTPSTNRSFTGINKNSTSNLKNAAQPIKAPIIDNFNSHFDDDDDLLLAAAEMTEDALTDSVISNSTTIQKSKCQSLNKFPRFTHNSSSNQPTMVVEPQKEISNQIRKFSGNQQSSVNPVVASSNFSSGFRTVSNSNEKSNTGLRQSKLSSFSFEKRNKLSSSTASSSTGSSLKSIFSSPPYQYICFMSRKPLTKTSYIIKGFVTTLLSKLEQNDGKWNLSAKVNDGTGSCDVDIDDQVLQKIIGMSVEEFVTSKQEARKNPQLKVSLAQRLLKCQMELIRMCCLMTIETCSSLRPRIVDILPLTETHFHELRERSKILGSKLQ